MKSLHTSHEPGAGQRRLAGLAATMALMCAACVTSVVPRARALSPNKALSQYIRDLWTEEQGFPGGPIYTMAQTKDGYLWLGTEKGLVRFDGLSFRLFQAADSFPTGPILGLLTDRGGDLWVRAQGPQFYRYHNGNFQNMLPGLPVLETDVTAMCLGHDGSLLFSGLGNGIVQAKDGKLSVLTDRSELPRLVIAMAEAPDGKIWLGTREQGVFYLEDGKIHPVTNGVPDRKINALLALDHHHVWLATDNGVAEGSSAGFSRPGAIHDLDHRQALTILKDRDSNVWVGTRAGLARVGPDGALMSESGSASAVTSLFEDREGNLWVGREQGLERVRDSVFTSYSVAAGLPSDSNGPVYVDAERRIWFAPMQGGLYWMRNGEVHPVRTAGLEGDVVYSISGGKDGLWLGRRNGGLTHLRALDNPVVAENYTAAKGLAQNSVYAVHENRDGTVWAATLSSGLSVLRNGAFKTYRTADGLLSDSISAILESGDGTMWFGTPNGLNSFANGRWRGYTSRDGLPPGSVNCLYEDSGGTLWVGSASGLGFRAGGKIEAPHEVSAALHEPILGIREDQAGSMWVATEKHVLRFDRDEMLHSSPHNAEVREYGVADGLRSTMGVKRYESVVSGHLGRIWFSMSRGLSFVEPRPLSESSAPAIVHVDALSADGRMISLGGSVKVASPHQRIALNYNALSLAVPGRVMFRYRLDPFDQGWSEPTAARQAIYTNLDSGTYRFRVIASNSDGVWNSSESVAQFQVEPAFWQSWWFRSCTLLALAGGVLAFIRLRVLTLTRELSLRFEERLSERTRIAQDLHDTLLQGFLSASMQLHVADDQIPADAPAKPLVGRVLELMRQMIDEGRTALRGLRSSRHNPVDLERAFTEIRQEFPVEQPIEFRVIVEGTPRTLRPIIGDEVFLIGREALSNAFRHSRATDIEVELEYAPSHLRLSIRDNGGGIDPQVLQSGREGHWGLSGMKERTERIGGKLRLMSRATAGTEVELSVPGRVAFES